MPAKSKKPAAKKPAAKKKSKPDSEELETAIRETISGEVLELLTEHWEEINSFIRASASQSISLSLSVNINRKKATVSTKTSLTASRRIKDDVEHELDDPDQERMDIVLEEAAA